MQDINNSGDFDCTCTQSTGVYTPNKLAMILKLEQAFSYTLKMRSPGGIFSQIKVIVGD